MFQLQHLFCSIVTNGTAFVTGATLLQLGVYILACMSLDVGYWLLIRFFLFSIMLRFNRR